MIDDPCRNLLRVEELAFRLPGFRLGPLSFSVPAGQITAILGGPGAGKTTLVDLVTGHRKPSHGTIDVVDVTSEVFCFPNPLPPRETLRQALRRNAPENNHAPDEIDRLAALFQVTDILDRPSEQLSPQQQVIASVISALPLTGGILVMDGSLDALPDRVQGEILVGLSAMARARGFAVILSTCRSAAAMKAHQFLVLREGQSVALGNPYDLLLKLGQDQMFVMADDLCGVSNAAAAYRNVLVRELHDRIEIETSESAALSGHLLQQIGGAMSITVRPASLDDLI